MLTIKVFLTESGQVSTIRKDFPIFQNVYQNILLNVFVPTSILSPNFQIVSEEYQKIVTPYIGGTAVRVACRTIARNGVYALSNSHYLRFVKTLYNSEDGKQYALFERLLPKDFVVFDGQGVNAPKMITNVVNILYGVISSYTLTSSNEELTVSTTLELVRAHFKPVDQTYVFTYTTNGWTLYGNIATLSDYGITCTGTPSANDTITLTTTAESPTVESVVTSQECALEVLPSSNLVNDESIDQSELARLNAIINSITAILPTKQDETDNDLQTTQKTIVGAINEVAQNIAMGEKYIGTYNYVAESVLDLPSNAQMLAYVKSIKGNDYVLKGGELVIVVQQLSGATDKNYRYFYNASTSQWDHYEIPPIEKAGNGFAGVVQGTYGVGETGDTLVSIVNGKITAIYVKVQGVYTEINSAFVKTDVGATKNFVKEYALPNSFNDRTYFGDDHYTSTTPQTFSYATDLSTIGNNLVGTWEHINQNYEYTLTKKNGGTAQFWVKSTLTGVKDFILKVYHKVSGGDYSLISISYLTDVEMTQNVNKSILFNYDFAQLGETELAVANGDYLKFELIYSKEQSTSETFTCFGSAVNVSDFYLLINAQAIVSSEVSQYTGTSTTATMSQDAITKYGKSNNLELTKTNVDIVYDTENGLQITATGKDTRANGDVITQPVSFNIPLVAGDNVVIDESEQGNKLLIKAETPVDYELLQDGTYNFIVGNIATGNLVDTETLFVTINAPNSATSGTFTSAQMEILNGSEDNYIFFNGLEYHYTETISLVMMYTNVANGIVRTIAVNTNGSWTLSVDSE